MADETQATSTSGTTATAPGPQPAPAPASPPSQETSNEPAGPDFAAVSGLDGGAPGPFQAPPVPPFYPPEPPPGYYPPQQPQYQQYPQAPPPPPSDDDYFKDPQGWTRRETERQARQIAAEMVRPIAIAVLQERETQKNQRLGEDLQVAAKNFDSVVRRDPSYRDPNVQREIQSLVIAARRNAERTGDGSAFRDPRFFHALMEMARQTASYRSGQIPSIAGPGTQTLSSSSGASSGTSPVTMTPEELDVCARMGLTQEEFLKNKKDALERERQNSWAYRSGR